jgi:hypothetical protein
VTMELLEKSTPLLVTSAGIPERNEQRSQRAHTEGLGRFTAPYLLSQTLASLEVSCIPTPTLRVAAQLRQWHCQTRTAEQRELHRDVRIRYHARAPVFCQKLGLAGEQQPKHVPASTSRAVRSHCSSLIMALAHLGIMLELQSASRKRPLTIECKVESTDARREHR